jgi:hypothetical protein
VLNELPQSQGDLPHCDGGDQPLSQREVRQTLRRARSRAAGAILPAQIALKLVPARLFFSRSRDNTQEGFPARPMYGGNPNKQRLAIVVSSRFLLL